MSYEVYNHKQAQNGILESPQSDLGFAQTPQTNGSINALKASGLLLGASRIAGAGKQLFNNVIDSQGDILVQQTVDGIGQALSIGVEVATLGAGGAALVEGTRFLINLGTSAISNKNETINQNYYVQKRGVAINKFVGTGDRID